MREIFVRAMRPSDLQEAYALLNDALGDGYIKKDELSKHVESESKLAKVAVTAKDDVLAAVTGELLPPNASLTEVAHEVNEEELNRLVPEVATRRVGILKSIAVGPPARKSGLGGATSAAVVGQLFREGAECVITFAWTDHEGCHSERMLKRLGFEKRGDINGFWNEDSKEKGYSCPSCEKDCKCVASIFAKVAG